ncbi:MAG: hypothetical protein ACFFCM_12500 [Promethearchaeota archaeon]
MTIPVVGWHLRMLEEFNFVIKEKMNGHESYFDSSVNPKERKLHFLFSKEKSRSIVEYFMMHNEGVTKIELSKELKMSRNTVKKYIDRFYKIGVLNSKKISNKTLYFLKEEFSILKPKKLKIKK